MPPKQTAANPAHESFESAIERLEQIVEEMESDKLPLEHLLSRYEEGSTLVKVCQDKLESAERRLEVLTTKGATGKPQAAPFDPEAAAATAATAAPAARKAAPAPVTEKASAGDDISLF